MRRKLLETFDDIYILNLHGSSRVGERTPDGGKDENVFDIQQGVTIALYVKTEKPRGEKKVYYADLWGLRSEKYEYLLGNDLEATRWHELKPVAPYYFLVPKDFALQEVYERFWKVKEIFKEWSSGVKTSRDKFVVGFTKDEITQKVRVFTGLLPDELVKQSLKLRDTRDWSLSNARRKAKTEKLEDKVITYAYRAFDNRLICYSFSLIEPGNDRFLLMRNLLHENLAICSTRIISGEHFEHTFVSDMVGDYCYISNKTKEVNYFFPLHLYPEQPKGQLFEKEAGELKPVPNFTEQFLQAVKESLGTEPTPEEIFYYIYAVLYSPIYRKRYEEFLKIDFPRIPLPSNYELFKTLSNLGKELVNLHLLKHMALNETGIGFPESGSNKVERVRYDETAQRVYISKNQLFEGISEEVWEYRIGAYQVMEKYLKDRKGRKLSLDEINHYMKVGKAIRLTIELQGKLDEIYARIDRG